MDAIRHRTRTHRNKRGNTARRRTLAQLLSYRALRQPERVAYTFLGADDTENSLTYAALDRQARIIAGLLVSQVEPGARVLLCHPPGLEFVASLYGCLYAGAVAVPAYPSQNNRSTAALQAIVANAAPAAALVGEDSLAGFAEAGLKQVPLIVTGRNEEAATDVGQPLDLDPDSLALLQFTSGSTTRPRGVMLSHANLLHNSQVIAECFGHTPHSRGVIWLPPYHDMGLIGGVLQPLYVGFPVILMGPATFLQRPLRWLEAITRHRATTSGGPSFAYRLCVERTAPEDRAKLDLSSWSVAFNGAEPVDYRVLEAFSDAFGPFGFQRSAFYPCYGLAEATLLVTGGEREVEPVVQSFSRAALERSVVELAEKDEQKVQRLVGCGAAQGGQRLAIVDTRFRREQSANAVGEIWVAGPSVAGGYWDNPEGTLSTFDAFLATGEGPFLRTGDIGFMRDGELFVVGRIKDLIIIRGKNYLPHDIETMAASSHPLLSKGAVAAFTSVADDSEERLIVVKEIHRHAARKADWSALVRAVRSAVANSLNVRVQAVVFVRDGSLPRTTSGKIQRYLCRQAFEGNTLDVVHAWQAAPAGPAFSPGAPAARSADEIMRFLIARLSADLGLATADIDIDAPFADFGMGSFEAVQLSDELKKWLGADLTPTVAYDYPSIRALARHLAGGTEDPPVPAAPVSSTAGPIAIIGLACRFPGAGNADDYWRLLANGRDAISEVPPDRWPVDELFDPDPKVPGKMVTRWGGFLDEVDCFDASFFGISPREAENMDPQQRLLLEVSWDALEHAGLPLERIGGSAAGVFVGVSNADYFLRSPPSFENIDAYLGTGSALSIAANRVSYAFDLRGPSAAVDTACSSSLVALHLACRSLQNHDCEMALAGGVNLILSPVWSLAFSKFGFMAADGRCKTFDARADGYVRGEGCGVVVLKRLDDAIADGDRILATIAGSAVNQDGRTAGLTAPNGLAQRRVVRDALHRAAVEPSDINYIEAHGTGTPLGDPIEVEALADVFGRGSDPDRRKIAIASVKTNIGHLEAAAGIASVIKVVLALRNEMIPPHLHFQTPNPNIPMHNTPFVIPTEPRPWPKGSGRRLAGVSSFGFGGTNAHVVLEEAPRD